MFFVARIKGDFHLYLIDSLWRRYADMIKIMLHKNSMRVSIPGKLFVMIII